MNNKNLNELIEKYEEKLPLLYDAATFIGFDIVYTLEENIYKHGSVQLQIEDIREAEEFEAESK